MKKIEIIEYKEIPLDKIEISEANVRRSRQLSGIEELKTSIKKFGLIHPVIVVKKGEKYELIVGQRRYYAFKQLKYKKIPALIIQNLDEITKRIVSLSENIHRKKLPYSDTIEACSYLFKKYKGSKKEKIEKIAKELGISTSTVIKYLSYQLVPEEVRKMVDDGKISASLAWRITSAFWPNEEKIKEIAKIVTRMSRPEIDSILTVAREKPGAPIKEIIEEAKKRRTVEVILRIPSEWLSRLNRLMKERNVSNLSELIMSIIEERLSEEI